MADGSSIEWTDATWNPVRGCSRLSPGCGGPNHQGGCYAETIAARFSGQGQPFEGFAERTAHGGRWTGKMDVAWNMVDQPIRWRRPRRIFANSMSDLFHKDLPRDDVAIIYGTAIAAVHLRGHTIQILTKRADHMRELLNDEEFWEIANAHASSLVIEHTDPLNRRKDDARATCGEYGPDAPPGIWLGVSVEDQERADERIPHLLATPAAKRFISAEPLLGAIDLTELNIDGDSTMDALSPLSSAELWQSDWAPEVTGTTLEEAIEGFTDWGYRYPPTDERPPALDWVIAGGESGTGARPSHPDWFRSLRDQCAAAGVPFFFKQWGSWGPLNTSPPKESHAIADDGTLYRTVDLAYPDGTRYGEAIRKDHHKASLHTIYPVGKKAAGAELDGKTHREFPT